MKKLIFTMVFLTLSGTYLSSFASERWLSSYKQKVIYDSKSGEAEIGITRDGIKVKYAYEGSKVIGVKGYCGFAFDTCDPEKVNYVILLNTNAVR